MFRRFAFAIALVPLAACSGGGGGSSAPGTPTVTPTGGPQSNYVRPQITFKEPSKLHPKGKGKGGKYISASAEGVTVTLVSSTAGLSGISASTDLTSPGVCTAGTCTITGPPIPPGSDVLDVKLYDAPPTPSVGGTEPVGANILAQSTSSATPTQIDQSFTITAGTTNTVNITLYGVPALLPISNGASTFTANTTGSANVPLTVEDHSGNVISGEFSGPVTVTDSDTGTQGTSLSLNAGGSTAATETLNFPGDVSLLVAEYGGLAEVAPTITATAAGGVTSGASTPFNITLNPIVVSPLAGYGAETQTADGIDLFAESGTGSTAAVTVSELGWSNSPFNKTFGDTPGMCSVGTPTATYTLTTTDSLTFTDTAPASAAPGICPVAFTDFSGGQSVTETLTYTETVIGVNKKNHLLHPTRTH